MFAYGQTGSGKTYTMAGQEEKLAQEDYVPDSSEGLIPRAFHKLFQYISESQNNIQVKASFTEIYNE